MKCSIRWCVACWVVLCMVDIHAQIPEVVGVTGFESNMRSGVQAVASDAEGNLVLSGWFEDTVDLDPGPGVHVVTDAGDRHIFFAKIDPDFNLIWSFTLPYVNPSGNNFEISDMLVGVGGTIHVVGRLTRGIDFDPGPEEAILATGHPAQELGFWASYTSDGEFVQVRRLGDFGNGVIRGAAAGPSGSVYVHGEFNTSIDFEPGPGVEPSAFMISSGVAEYIAKYDSEYRYEWSVIHEHASETRIWAATTDAEGRVLFAGTFRGTVDLDQGPDVHEVTSNGSLDLYVVTLDYAGNLVQAVTFGGTGEDYPLQMQFDPDGNLVVLGSFPGVEIDWSSTGSKGTEIPISLPGGTGFDGHLLQLNPSGDFIKAGRFVGPEFISFEDFEIRGDGRVFLCGRFTGTMDFDPSRERHLVTGEFDWNMFLAELAPDWSVVSVLYAGTDLGVSAYDLVTGRDNDVFVVGAYDGSMDFDPGPAAVTRTAPVNGEGFILKVRPAVFYPDAMLNVPFFLDTAPDDDTYPPSSGFATYVALHNTAMRDLELSVEYFDAGQNGSIDRQTPVPNTFLLPSMATYSFRPVGDDARNEGPGAVVPNMPGGENAGTATIGWSGFPDEVQGRVVQINPSGNTFAYLLPPGMER